jgi:hypothetical protein
MMPSRSLRAVPIKKIRQRRHDQPQAFSDVHDFSPHRHSNMWNVRPAEGLNMLVMNFGCAPHFKQRGEVGFSRSCFSMPHRMPAWPYRRVKNR